MLHHARAKQHALLATTGEKQIPLALQARAADWELLRRRSQWGRVVSRRCVRLETEKRWPAGVAECRRAWPTSYHESELLL